VLSIYTSTHTPADKGTTGKKRQNGRSEFQARRNKLLQNKKSQGTLDFHKILEFDATAKIMRARMLNSHTRIQHTPLVLILRA
jgi:hypothetical protein